MRTTRLALAAVFALASALPALAAAAKREPDITGAWERWPSQMYPTKGPIQFGTPPMPAPPERSSSSGAPDWWYS